MLHTAAQRIHGAYVELAVGIALFCGHHVPRRPPCCLAPRHGPGRTYSRDCSDSRHGSAPPPGIQPDGFFLVLCHAAAVVIHQSKVELPIGISCSAEAVPLEGFLVALRNAAPRSYIKPRLAWLSACPCAAARANHLAACSSFLGTPRPFRYTAARSNWACASPACAFSADRLVARSPACYSAAKLRNIKVTEVFFMVS